MFNEQENNNAQVRLKVKWTSNFISHHTDSFRQVFWLFKQNLFVQIIYSAMSFLVLANM